LVSLDDAVIARLKKGEQHFEILVDPYAAADLIDGKEIDVMQNLAIDAIFKDSKKGTHASEESLQKIFGTNDINQIAKEIIIKGDIQLTTEQRHKMQKNKKNRIIETIVRNAMDPKTKAPHPRQRIELAIDQTGVHIDPFKPVSEQVKVIIDALRPIIPISMENVRISVKIDP
jgi:ribosome maturation protein SDO1